MKIDSTDFGSITIDGATYPHDVVIRLSGEVLKRKKSVVIGRWPQCVHKKHGATRARR